MQKTQKHSNAENLQTRISNMKTHLAEYQEAIRTGYFHGRKMSGEDFELAHHEIADLEYYIKQDTWKLKEEEVLAQAREQGKHAVVLRTWGYAR